MRIGAGCLFTRGDGQVLLVKPGYKPLWELPGGGVAPGESPLAACRREVREELGLDVTPSGLLVVDYRNPGGRRRGGAMSFVFRGPVLTGEQIASIRLQRSELTAFQFVPADRLAEYTEPFMARRLRACLDADGRPGSGYLEDGQPPPG